MMKNIFLPKRFVLVHFSIVIALFCSLNLVQTSYSQCPIIPSPAAYQEGNSSIRLEGELSVNTENLPDRIKDYLVRQMTDKYGLTLVFSANGRHLEFKRLQNVPQDHYSIRVAEKITISYSSEESCFYALNSLLQMMRSDEDGVEIRECFVSDQPRFQWRGLHLDVSRHFFTVEEVKRFIELMAYYKFNTFHWHLTDDQGWRIEIKKYPKLTEIGAWRDSTVNQHYNTVPRTYTTERYGGFYTQEDIREVVRFAQKHFITVVPEIEMPGHSRAALAAYPELSCFGEQLEVPGLWGVFDDIYCNHHNTIEFLKDVLSEVIDLFPSEYIHIGGDEAPKERWKRCKKCQAVLRENGLKDEHELQSWFVQQMDDYLTQHGRKLIGWDEILEGGLSSNAAVMSWRGFEGGIEAASQGHYVVMSPGSHCYFDHYQSKHPNEPLAIGGFTSLEKVYSFDPVAPEMTPDQAAFVLGGQANVWTEYIPTFQQVEYMVYPRALALAQALWCQKKPIYSVFKETLIKHHLPFLKKLNVNYSEALFYPEMTLERSEEGVKVAFVAENSEDLSVSVADVNNGLASSVKEFELKRTTNNSVNPTIFTVQNKMAEKTSVYTVVEHPALGLNIEYITLPSKSYNSGGDLTLVDGVIGASPWRGNEWVGFRETEIEFIVDLGQKKKMESIELNFLTDEGSWIYQPNEVRFEISNTKKKWKSLAKATAFLGSKKMNAGRYLLLGANIEKKGRYLKVKILPFDQIPEGKPGAGNVPWTFMDELMIFYK
jgi:hexosaminidase